MTETTTPPPADPRRATVEQLEAILCSTHALPQTQVEVATMLVVRVVARRVTAQGGVIVHPSQIRAKLAKITGNFHKMLLATVFNGPAPAPRRPL
jgi:hypothetical protein